MSSIVGVLDLLYSTLLKNCAVNYQQFVFVKCGAAGAFSSLFEQRPASKEAPVPGIAAVKLAAEGTGETWKFLVG